MMSQAGAAKLRDHHLVVKGYRNLVIYGLCHIFILDSDIKQSSVSHAVI